MPGRIAARQAPGDEGEADGEDDPTTGGDPGAGGDTGEGGDTGDTDPAGPASPSSASSTASAASKPPGSNPTGVAATTVTVTVSSPQASATKKSGKNAASVPTIHRAALLVAPILAGVIMF
jgi:hypothetical protein